MIGADNDSYIDWSMVYGSYPPDSFHL